MRNTKRILAAFAIALAVSIPAAAVNLTAVASNVTGTVEKSAAGGAWKALSNHDKLNVGDKVRTAAGASALLSFGEGNVLSLSPLTSVTLTSMSAEGKVKTSVLTVDKGRLYAAARKLKNSESVFKVQTPHVISGVRGSEVFATVGDKNTTLQVVEGVFSIDAKGKTGELKAGFQMDISDSITDLPAAIQIDPAMLESLRQEAREKSDAGKAAENLSLNEDATVEQATEAFENLQRAQEGTCQVRTSCYSSSCYTYLDCGHDN